MRRRILIAFGPKPYQRLVLLNTGRRPMLAGVVEHQHHCHRSPWVARLVDGTEVGTFDCESHALHYLARQVAPLSDLDLVTLPISF
jgi:hypothetical protein